MTLISAICLRGTLRLAGYEVYAARALRQWTLFGRSARRCHGRCRTPGYGRFEVLRRIRDVSGAQLVVLSGRVDEQDVQAAFDAGAVDYIPKPLRPKDLLARIRAVMCGPGLLRSGYPDLCAQGFRAPASLTVTRSQDLVLS